MCKEELWLINNEDFTITTVECIYENREVLAARLMTGNLCLYIH